jgi:acyl-CoA thioesterase-1
MEKTMRSNCRRFLTLLLSSMLFIAAGQAHAVTILALGASNTYGKGVARSEAYPAQLEALLRARGLSVRVVNGGINGDTTAGMLRRLEGALRGDTKVVILQPGGNDRRKGQESESAGNLGAIEAKLNARGMKVVTLPSAMLHGLPHQPDGEHLTPEGYHMLAEALLPQVVAAMGH